MPFRNEGEIKTFPEKERRKERMSEEKDKAKSYGRGFYFSTTNPVLHEMLKEFFKLK